MNSNDLLSFVNLGIRRKSVHIHQIIVLVVLAVIVLWFVGAYNGFVRIEQPG